MNLLFSAPGLLMSLITLVVFVFQAWAFLDAVSRRADAFVAADKMTKQAWLIILDWRSSCTWSSGACSSSST